ncbi:MULTISPECIES: aldehyde dehydrogenase family protein [Cohnella]|uniref:aldehyde dehydrogenase family protein n=1 Tax=Cohnella TaxID=329857 RepID=UPI0009BA01FE|nr:MULTISPECIES: aldehyde dehydrogenase family protein [Cohnella]MBN2981373.1 aldehyde dehydrogenase family protein [Cohnella algarum]
MKDCPVYSNYIGGEWTSAAATMESYNPATGELVGYVQKSTREDALRAIDAAEAAFRASDWGTNPKRRYEALLALALKIEENKEALAKWITVEQGKTIREARTEIAGCIDTLKYFAGASRSVFGRSIQLEPTNFGIIVKEPIGVVGLITPWNWPALLLIRELAPALAAGNAVVVKPASLTSICSIELIKFIDEIDFFPKGIVSIVTGPGAEVGEAMGRSAKLGMISLTGDTSTGKRILEMSAVNIKKAALELGGKSPNILFDDADFDKAIPVIGKSIFISAGQICMAGSRLIVHESIADKAVAALKRYAESLVVGNGLSETVDMGPLVSASQVKLVEEFVEIGRQQGRIVTGGYRLTGEGYDNGNFYAPTIIADLAADCRIVKEEIFGPVLAVQTFRTDDEALRLANDSDFGLSAGVWTTDFNRAVRFAKRIEAGTVWINTYNKNFPEAEFGGYKQSGLGRTRGVDGLNEYCETKHIHFEGEF